MFFKSKDYEFELLKPQSEWQGLVVARTRDAHQSFQRRNSTTLSSLKNRFYTALPVMQQNIKAQLKNKGMYLLDPDSAKALTLLWAVVIAAPFVLLHADKISLTNSPAVTASAISRHSSSGCSDGRCRRRPFLADGLAWRYSASRNS